MATLSILARMKDPEDEDVRAGQLVADLVVADQNPPYLLRLDLGQPTANTRVGSDALCAGDEMADDAGRGSSVDWAQKLVQRTRSACARRLTTTFVLVSITTIRLLS